jgi:hypothetical protein
LKKEQATTTTTAVKKEQATTTTTPAVKKEQGLWEKLETMCAALANSEATANGHSFQLGGTTSSSTNHINSNSVSSSSVDLSGTFLRHDPYDFVEFNAAGEVVMEVRHPMFPEDFSRAGMKEHPLSWWGILDPVQGEGKYRTVPPPQPTMMDHRIQSQQAPPGQPQAQPQQQQYQQQQYQQQQQQQPPPPPPWPTHGRDRGGRPMENGGMTRGGRTDAAGPPRWNGHGPPMEQGAPWMGPPPNGGGPHRGSAGMPPNGDVFRGGGGPGMPPNGGRGGGGGGPGPGRGRPHAPHSRQHGRR